jgi:nucleotide-binding universal stress UspA family protein
MYRRVLVPLDGSSFAEYALPIAAELAVRLDAVLELALVHTSYSVATADAGIHATVARWQQDQREREAAYLEEVAARGAGEWGVEVQLALLTGEVAGALRDQVAGAGADLVVMTTHGRSGLERVWLGSVADALIRQVAVPVLLVRPGEGAPERAAGRPFRHVAVALDGSELAEHSLRTVQGLLDRESRITLLRVVVPPRGTVSSYPPHVAAVNRQLTDDRAAEAEAYLADVARRLREVYAAVDVQVLTDYHPAQAIVRWAHAHGVDGIALSTHGRAPALRLLLGSITDEVVRRGSVPVLVG